MNFGDWQNLPELNSREISFVDLNEKMTNYSQFNLMSESESAKKKNKSE